MARVKKIRIIFFSPHGNTQKSAEAIGKLLAEKMQVPFETDSITNPENRKAERFFAEDELEVFAMPTYAGKLPNKILPAVKTLFKGNRTPAVAMVTFGNRSFDNALAELKQVLTDNNFIVIGAAAIACKHAFAEIGAEFSIEKEGEILTKLCGAVFQKLEKKGVITDITVTGDPLAPYYTPLLLNGKPAQFLKAKPVTEKSKCDNCGTCAALCPTAAINKENVCEVPGVCIKCQSCIIHCHTGAKYFTDEQFLSHKAMLERDYTRLASSEIFI